LVGVSWGVLTTIVVIVAIGVVLTMIVRRVDVEIHINVEIDSSLLVVEGSRRRRRIWLVGRLLWIAWNTGNGCGVVHLGGEGARNLLEILCFGWHYVGRVGVWRFDMADRFLFGSSTTFWYVRGNF